MPEFHLVGLPGPLHGATAPTPANPRAAATQTIGLMRTLHRLGIPVAVLPPLARPDATVLRAVGFAGDDATLLAAAALRAPELHRIACTDAASRTSAIATSIPAHDSSDGRIKLVVANQVGGDGQIDAAVRAAQLRALFPDRSRAIVHDPLPAITALADGGAGNHHRVATGEGTCHLLIHAGEGRSHLRQTRAASEALARLCGLVDPLHIRLAEAALAAGAASGEAVMSGCRDRLLIHELAWNDQAAVLEAVRHRVGGVRTAVVRDGELPIAEALRSRLFGSCLVRGNAGHALVCSSSCRLGPARRILDRLLGEGFVGAIEHVDLDAALPDAGGPASLRLRLVIAAEATATAIHPGIVCDQHRFDTLEAWVRSTYRERIGADDLGNPQVHEEAHAALDLLARLLGLPSGFYAAPGSNLESSRTAQLR